MVRLLRQFRYTDFLVLTDEPVNVANVLSKEPTRRNIKDGIRWLHRDSTSESTLFFHFAGHGSQETDRNGDEVDGLDETILPVDYERKGSINDDELYDALAVPLSKGARLHALMDCCHSGTGLDLPYVHDTDGPTLVDEPQPRGRRGWWSRKKSLARSGTTVLYSACRDDEEASDIRHVISRGACTSSFENAARQALRGTVTHREVLRSMRVHMIANSMRQKPQLSTSHVFDSSFLFDI